MPELQPYISAVYAVIMISLLGFAAWRDLATRTIPDGISVGLILLGAVARLSQGWTYLIASLSVAILLFILLLPFCSRGILGGADLKLTASLAAGFPPQTSLHLLLAITAIGGMLAGLYLLLGKLLRQSATPRPFDMKTRWRVRRVAGVEFWRIRRRAPLPYGIAIALGAAVVVFQQQGV